MVSEVITQVDENGFFLSYVSDLEKVCSCLHSSLSFQFCPGYFVHLDFIFGDFIKILLTVTMHYSFVSPFIYSHVLNLIFEAINDFPNLKCQLNMDLHVWFLSNVNYMEYQMIPLL